MKKNTFSGRDDVVKPNNKEKLYTAFELEASKKIDSFSRFIEHEITISAPLFIMSIIAILMCSTESFQEYYFNIIHAQLVFDFDEVQYSVNLIDFSNDFLMSIFFFYLGIEVKKEFSSGILRDEKVGRTIVLAAIGGVLAPAAIYFFISTSASESACWAIPIATDTAFALGFLSLLKGKIPDNLVVFLAGLSVIDDLFSVFVVSSLHFNQIDARYLYLSAIGLLMLIFMNKAGIRHYFFYLIMGLIVWFFIEESNLHGTLAGLLVAFSIPIKPKHSTKEIMKKTNRLLDVLKKKESKTRASAHLDSERHHVIEDLEKVAVMGESPLIRLHHMLTPLIFYFVLPVFSFVNSGTPYSLSLASQAFYESLSRHVFISLFLGKFLGVFGMTIISTRFFHGKLPEGINKYHLVILSLVSGIGFTMSFFMAEIVNLSEALMGSVKVMIITSSLLSATLVLVLAYGESAVFKIKSLKLRKAY